MILDDGICTVYRKVNTAEAGGMPVFQDQAYHRSWYGVLSFETAPVRPTDKREEIQTDARVRILQNRHIANHHRVTLQNREGTVEHYEVERAYHGIDPDNGEMITDLNLKAVNP